MSLRLLFSCSSDDVVALIGRCLRCHADVMMSTVVAAVVQTVVAAVRHSRPHRPCVVALLAHESPTLGSGVHLAAASALMVTSEPRAIGDPIRPEPNNREN